MTQSIIQPSFAGGEVSASLFGRVDLAKYKIAAARMRNFFVDYRGGASTRPGTRYVNIARDSVNPVRLIPFQFSTNDTAVLEFGHYYMRVIVGGAPVLETPKPISAVSQANPAVVTVLSHGYVSGDSVYVAGAEGMTALNGQTYVVQVLTANTFYLLLPTYVNFDSSALPAYSGNGTVARLFAMATPWAGADLALLKFTQSADVMTFCHPSYPIYDLTRTAAGVYNLAQVTLGSAVPAPTGIVLTGSTTGSTYFGYTVTAVLQTGEESVGATPAQTQTVNISATAGTISIVWNAVIGAAYYRVYKFGNSVSTAIPAGAPYGFLGIAYGLQFNDTNIVADFQNQPPRGLDPFAPRQITGYMISAGGTGYVAGTTTTTVIDATGSGAVVYPVIVGGVITGLIIDRAGRNYTAPIIVASGPGTGFQATLMVGPSTGTYPGCSGYFQQRKVYAAPINSPQSLWLSKPGAFKNFDQSNPINDGDSLSFTLASQQVNAIKSLVPMPGGLLAFTSGGVWQLSGGGQNAPITPTSAIATPQSYNGASDVPPIAVNYDLLYVQAKGSVVRNLQYNLFANIYTSSDLTVLANHLFRGYSIKEWAYAEDPFKLIHCVRSDGTLLILTFLKEQELQGWSRHDTQGTFESVCAVKENNTDAVYYVVRRTINGVPLRFIERAAERTFTTGVQDAWCVDCGLDLTVKTPVTQISGLDHLEGLTVQILGDGDVLTPQIVVNGRITLSRGVQRLIVGLGYTAQLQTLPLDVGEPTMQGKRKKIVAVTVRMESSRGLKVGPRFRELTEIKERTPRESYGPIPLQTGDERIIITSRFTVPGQTAIQQDYPLPATVLAVIPEVVPGDTGNG